MRFVYLKADHVKRLLYFAYQESYDTGYEKDGCV